MRRINLDTLFPRPWPLIFVLLAAIGPIGCGESAEKATGGQAVVPQEQIEADRAQAEFMKKQAKGGR